jgi:hypothetical protein
LTRQSIVLAKKMDPRVKPAGDHAIEGYSFFAASTSRLAASAVDASSPHSGASTPSPQARGR